MSVPRTVSQIFSIK